MPKNHASFLYIEKNQGIQSDLEATLKNPIDMNKFNKTTILASPLKENNGNSISFEFHQPHCAVNMYRKPQGNNDSKLRASSSALGNCSKQRASRLDNVQNQEQKYSRITDKENSYKATNNANDISRDEIKMIHNESLRLLKAHKMRKMKTPEVCSGYDQAKKGAFVRSHIDDLFSGYEEICKKLDKETKRTSFLNTPAMREEKNSTPLSSIQEGSQVPDLDGLSCIVDLSTCRYKYNDRSDEEEKFVKQCSNYKDNQKHLNDVFFIGSSKKTKRLEADIDRSQISATSKLRRDSGKGSNLNKPSMIQMQEEQLFDTNSWKLESESKLESEMEFDDKIEVIKEDKKSRPSIINTHVSVLETGTSSTSTGTSGYMTADFARKQSDSCTAHCDAKIQRLESLVEKQEKLINSLKGEIASFQSHSKPSYLLNKEIQTDYILERHQSSQFQLFESGTARLKRYIIDDGHDHSNQSISLFDKKLDSSISPIKLKTERSFDYGLKSINESKVHNNSGDKIKILTCYEAKSPTILGDGKNKHKRHVPDEDTLYNDQSSISEFLFDTVSSIQAAHRQENSANLRKSYARQVPEINLNLLPGCSPKAQKNTLFEIDQVRNAIVFPDSKATFRCVSSRDHSLIIEESSFKNTLQNTSKSFCFEGLGDKIFVQKDVKKVVEKLPEDKKETKAANTTTQGLNTIEQAMHNFLGGFSNLKNELNDLKKLIKHTKINSTDSNSSFKYLKK